MRPDPCLRLSRVSWTRFTSELHRRTEGYHESGAFLLGHKDGRTRTVVEPVYYDDLDPRAYATGVCVLHADVFGRLWDHCAKLGFTVVADAHVHPRRADQSRLDRENPMIGSPGHLALIFPWMARPPIRRSSLGLYEYLGDHQWRTYGGRQVSRVLKVEDYS